MSTTGDYNVCVQVLGLPPIWLDNLTVSIRGVKATIDWTAGINGADLENYDVTSGTTANGGIFKQKDVSITLYDETKYNSLKQPVETTETMGFIVNIKASDGTVIYNEIVSVDGSGAIVGPRHALSELTDKCLPIGFKFS